MFPQLEQYHEEIMDDLEANLTNREFRVRKSCCLALADLLKSNAQVDLAKRAPKLWKELFRVMDDHHEDTRLTAITTAKVLSRVCPIISPWQYSTRPEGNFWRIYLFLQICIRQCDPNTGKSGELVLQAILPILLDEGITHNVANVRAISLQTVSQLVTTAGSLLKPSLVTLMPALLAASDIENPKISYARTALGGQPEVQDAIDRMRANAAKSTSTMDTITKVFNIFNFFIDKNFICWNFKKSKITKFLFNGYFIFLFWNRMKCSSKICYMYKSTSRLP